MDECTIPPIKGSASINLEASLLIRPKQDLHFEGFLMD